MNTDHSQHFRVWRGVLIEESVADSSLLLGALNVLDTRHAVLEGEEHRGDFTFHSVTVAEHSLSLVAQMAKRQLSAGWYFHLVRGFEMKLFFKDVEFDVDQNTPSTIKAAQEYGIAQGIHPDQLVGLEGLYDDPFA